MPLLQILNSEYPFFMQKIHLEETKSTNTFLIEALAKGADYEECSVVYTLRQTAGRGQVGNSWESENDRNITFSMLLRPTFLPIKEQFIISELTCIAIVKALESFGLNRLSIKWPNDIYCADDKICGILIENALMGCTFSQCVIGIGININQTRWIGNAPNPTSMKLCTGAEHDPIAVMDKVSDNIIRYYSLLKQNRKAEIHAEYLELLYRKEGLHPYKDAETEREFMAQIKTVEPSGHLILEDAEGSTYRYMFKEIKFVLPCGVTKE